MTRDTILDQVSQIIKSKGKNVYILQQAVPTLNWIPKTQQILPIPCFQLWWMKKKTKSWNSYWCPKMEAKRKTLSHISLFFFSFFTKNRLFLSSLITQRLIKTCVCWVSAFIPLPIPKCPGHLSYSTSFCP